MTDAERLAEIERVLDIRHAHLIIVESTDGTSDALEPDELQWTIDQLRRALAEIERLKELFPSLENVYSGREADNLREYGVHFREDIFD